MHEHTVAIINSLFYMRVFGLVRRTTTLWLFSLLMSFFVCWFSLLIWILVILCGYSTGFNWEAVMAISSLFITPIWTILYLPLNIGVRYVIKNWVMYNFKPISRVVVVPIKYYFVLIFYLVKHTTHYYHWLYRKEDKKEMLYLTMH